MADQTVVLIRRKATRPPDCEKALALLKQASDILEGLIDSGQVEEGSPPFETRWYLNDAIGMLTPEKDEPSRG